MSFLGDFEFYWIRDNLIAGSSRPRSVENIKFIIDQGIKRIISISGPDVIKYYAENLPIEIIPFEFADFGIPSQDQIEQFYSIMEDSIKQHKPVLIHCAMGCGRTGLLLTAYLMKFEHKDWEESLHDIRETRPCAVESSNQLNFLSHLQV